MTLRGDYSPFCRYILREPLFYTYPLDHLLSKSLSLRAFELVAYIWEWTRVCDKIGENFKKAVYMGILNGSKNFDLFYRFNKFQLHQKFCICFGRCGNLRGIFS